ncbi:uncharacterized protein LOC119348353 [Triticum dicoccoides]|uniref:uncharacterized protein LOC119348353 n=1 Tax=Triticum dicoccoides TaxID=85692 RepID=UPI0018905D7B|nr:uncharacterized protein LOC119348353 [Triticum dicoccoides]
MARQQVNIQMGRAHNEDAPVDAPPDAGAPRAGQDPDGTGNPPGAAAGGGDASADDTAAPPAAEDRTVAAAQQATEDAEYLHKMRGWLMTVATLLVGFAFQAAMHPPAWMPKDFFIYFVRPDLGQPVASDSTTTDACNSRTEVAIQERRTITTPTEGGITVPLFFLSTMFTFGTGLHLVLELLVMKMAPSRSDMKLITTRVRSLALYVTMTFACGISANPYATLFVLGFFIVYCLFFFVCRRILESSEPRRAARR